MFARLFKSLKAAEIAPETQRQTVERALAEVNDVLARLTEKPPISFDPNSGMIGLTLPDQMPDEALALPAPDPAEKAVETTAQKTPEDSKPMEEAA